MQVPPQAHQLYPAGSVRLVRGAPCTDEQQLFRTELSELPLAIAIALGLPPHRACPHGHLGLVEPSECRRICPVVSGVVGSCAPRPAPARPPPRPEEPTAASYSPSNLAPCPPSPWLQGEQQQQQQQQRQASLLPPEVERLMRFTDAPYAPGGDQAEEQQQQQQQPGGWLSFWRYQGFQG